MRRITTEITVLDQSVGEEDEFGDYTESWSERQVPVYAIAPRSSIEPRDPNRASVVTGWEVYAPSDTVIGADARVILPGVDEECEVDGEVAVWDHNPHFPVTRQKGVVINVRRASG